MLFNYKYASVFNLNLLTQVLFPFHCYPFVKKKGLVFTFTFC